MILPKLRTIVLVVALIASARAPAAAQGTTGSVTGRVLAGDTGAGLPGAPVYIYNEENKEVARTSADAAGLFTLSLPPGVYYLNFSSPQRIVQGSGFQYPINDYVDQFLGGAASIELAQPITVTAGGQIQVPVQTLARGGVISGRVYDASTNATILGKLIDISAYSCRASYTATDRQGQYLLTGLPLAPHRLYEREGSSYFKGQTLFENANMVTVTSPITIPNIDFPIVPREMRTIYVKYQMPNGDPVTNIFGVFQRLDGKEIYANSSSVDGNGVQTFVGIPMSEAGPVKFRIFASPTHPAEYYNGKTTLAAADAITLTGATTFVTMTLSGSSGVTVSGFFVDQDTGQPIATLVDPQSGGVLSSIGGQVIDSSGAFAGPLTFDPTGQFVSVLLRPGSYRIQAYINGPQAKHVARAVTVTVGSTPLSTTIPLQSGGVISGRVTISGTNHEVDYARITLLDANDQPVSGPDFLSLFNMPANGGKYRLGMLPPGTYRVRVEEKQLAMMPDCRITSLLPTTYFERTVSRSSLAAAQSSRDIVVRAGEVTTANIAMPIAPFVPTPQPGATAQPTATARARDTRLFLPLTRR